MSRLVDLGEVEEYIIMDARYAGHAEKSGLPYGARVILGAGYILLEVDARLRKFNPVRTWFGFLVSTLLVPEAGLIYKSRTLRLYGHFTPPSYRVDAFCRLFIARTKLGKSPQPVGLACIGEEWAVERVAAIAVPTPQVLVTPYPVSSCNSNQYVVDFEPAYKLRGYYVPWRRYQFHICYNYTPPTPVFKLKRSEKTAKLQHLLLPLEPYETLLQPPSGRAEPGGSG